VQISLGCLLDALGLEFKGRELLCVEEICGSKVFVAPIVVRADAARINGDLYPRLCEILPINVNLAAELCEFTMHFGYHHVPDRKSHAGMCGIDFPGFLGRRGRS